MIRVDFQKQLTEMRDDLLAMGSRVDSAIAQAVQALVDRNVDLAHEVIAGDMQINQAHRNLEEKCLALIATQQPMAGDLRFILSVVIMAYEMERMGDHAEGIAELAIRLADQPHIKPLIDIPRMAEKARWMLKQELQAFVDRDITRAKAIAAEDDEMDALYDQIFRELLVLMMGDPRIITRATYLLWVAHNLERIADRATNLGERIVFLVTGDVAELNPERQRHEAEGRK
ncbi:MAG: phosphate signaling complex protein PhoU [Chloroflexi bacterium]|nr:phosphate signaling complex protein PhoU [Chloroflexota bacterium]